MTWVATAAWVTVGIAAASATVTVIGQKNAAEAQEEAGKLQNKAAEEGARNIELQTAENIRRQRANNRRRLSRIRTGMAGTSGLVMDGSMADAFMETAGQLELQVQDTARAGAMDASNTRSAGNMAMWEARTGAMATRIQSYGTLLSAAGSAGGTYAGYKADTYKPTA